MRLFTAKTTNMENAIIEINLLHSKRRSIFLTLNVHVCTVSLLLIFLKIEGVFEAKIYHLLPQTGR